MSGLLKCHLILRVKHLYEEQAHAYRVREIKTPYTGEYYILLLRNGKLCGNKNHLFCRKRKCEVDHPSQLTEVNIGKKQQWCFLWSLPQVQLDTTCQDNFRIMGCLMTIHVHVSDIEPRC